VLPHPVSRKASDWPGHSDWLFSVTFSGSGKMIINTLKQ
jgi:hypothetical protein